MVFWSVMIIVTATDVGLVMKADNDGEGGVMALITLRRLIGEGSRRWAAFTDACLSVCRPLDGCSKESIRVKVTPTVAEPRGHAVSGRRNYY